MYVCYAFIKQTDNDRIISRDVIVLTFPVPNVGEKFHQNQVKIASVGEVTDRQS